MNLAWNCTIRGGSIFANAGIAVTPFVVLLNVVENCPNAGNGVVVGRTHGDAPEGASGPALAAVARTRKKPAERAAEWQSVSAGFAIGSARGMGEPLRAARPEHHGI